MSTLEFALPNVLMPTYDDRNVFRSILDGRAPSHRIYENDAAVAFLDIAPQGPGHTLVVPRPNATNLFDIGSKQLGMLAETVQLVGRMLVSALDADGLEIQQFNGAAAGQTVFHLHFHLIPRFAGVSILPHSEAQPVDEAELALMATRILNQSMSPRGH